MRSDQERNRRRIVKAAVFLVARKGSAVRMADIADRADVSTATAYRHFASVDDVLAEFRDDVGRQLLDFSSHCEASGVALLEAVSQEWVRLVVKNGAAMIHSRSDQGYLKRLRAGTAYLSAQAEAVGRPITEAAAELGIPDLGDEGLFLWNVLFDPREIHDLLETVGLTGPQIGTRLVLTFTGAMRGWAAARESADVEAISA
ncbi:TetR/AcrR family transcriptional regulator [Microbacteriaceae bacterium VKM Ac-2854]|nr:TetR/AcrR family transcriptional regulator [Microbacteriaceae bacterium VKM Ac-2854]